MHYLLILGVAIALGGWMLYPLLTSQPAPPQSSTPQQKSSRKHRKNKAHPHPANTSGSHRAATPSSQSRVAPQVEETVERAGLVRELERIRNITDVDAAIEQDVQHIRNLPEFQHRVRSDTLPVIQIRFCPQCGTRLDLNTRWCKSCAIDVGHYLKEGA